MKTLTKYPKVTEDIQIVDLVAVINGEVVSTKLNGLYSPSFKKIIGDCKGRLKLTPNSEFIQVIENFAGDNIIIDEIFSMSQGGKICAVLSSPQFTKLAKKHFPKATKKAYNIEVKMFVIETNDTSFRLRFGAIILVNGKPKFVLSDNTTESEYRNDITLTSRSTDFRNLANNTLSIVDDFFKGLQAIEPLDIKFPSLMANIKQHFVKTENMSPKAVSMMADIETNIMILNEYHGENKFNYIVGVAEHLNERGTSDEDKQNEKFYFGVNKLRMDEVINSILNLTNKSK